MLIFLILKTKSTEAMTFPYPIFLNHIPNRLLLVNIRKHKVFWSIIGHLLPPLQTSKSQIKSQVHTKYPNIALCRIATRLIWKRELDLGWTWSSVSTDPWTLSIEQADCCHILSPDADIMLASWTTRGWWWAGWSSAQLCRAGGGGTEILSQNNCSLLTQFVSFDNFHILIDCVSCY